MKQLYLMFTIVIVSILFLNFGNINAQGTPPEVEWSATYGGYGGIYDDQAHSVTQTADGGYIVAGSTNSSGDTQHAHTDTYLVKTDSSGNFEWDLTYVGPSGDWANSIKQTVDGGYIVTGVTNYPYDIYLMKLDSLGHLIWRKTFGGSGSDRGRSVQQTMDEGYIVAGVTSDFYLLKTYSSGDMEWESTFDGGFNLHDEARSIQQLTDGSYVVFGWIGVASGDDDLYLLKTDSDGNKEWAKRFGGSGVDHALSGQQTSDGGYILAGLIDTYDTYLVKTDSAGNLQWEKTFNVGSGYDAAYSVQQSADGGYILTGPAISIAGSNNWDAYILKTDAAGNQEWIKILGGSGNRDNGESVQQTTDGGYILAGFTNSYGAGYRDFWLIKLAPEKIIVSIDIKPGSFPNSINLSSAGVIPVAILSSDTFSASTIDPDTISLAGARVKLVGKSEKLLCHEEDVNGDSLIDLVCQVITAEFLIEPGESMAVLEAQTFDGIPIRGEDSINIVPDQ